jgi:polysaccharide export outer membrane protein
MMMAKQARSMIGGLLLLSCTTAMAQVPSGQGYILGPEDQIEVLVYGQPDLSVKTRIKADGGITVPVIGPVKAAGRTPQALAEAIATQLRSGGVVKQPIVNVEIGNYVSRTVTALGAIGTPGIYPLDYPQTISTLLARAGGVRLDGSERVTLRRAGENGVRSLEVAALAADPKLDIELRPGDVVFVPPAEQFFIYGQVGAAGTYPIIANMTLRQALARGGGPTLAGSERRITLYRQGQAPMEADLEASVRKGDVIFVRERVF